MLVYFLIKNGANLDLQNNSGLTAVILSTIYSNTQSNLNTLNYLIYGKANLNLQDNNGDTAILLHCKNPKTSSVGAFGLLIAGGADTKIKNNKGLNMLSLLEDIISSMEKN